MTTILHVTDASFSGALYAITDMAREQAKRPGVSVAFAYVPRPQSPGIERIRELAGPQVRVHRLSERHHFAGATLLAHLRGALRREQPDIIHLHSSRAGMVGRLVALLTGRRDRVVYSPHGFSFERTVSGGTMRAVYTRLERAGALMGPALALCSPSEQRLARKAIPEARTAVLPNAVDVEQLQGISRRRHAQDAADGTGTTDGTDGADAPRPLTVVHVGRVTEQKLVGTFAGIAASWSEVTDVPARFVWIGDGDRSLLPPEVEVTGWLERDELLETMAASDLMLFTTAGEAMPMALLEAQALGLPAVASRVIGVVDVVEDGETGVLGRTEEELRDALVTLAEDPVRRREMGRAATARMAAHYDMSNLADRSFAAYAELGIPVPEMEGAS